ncbi:hypothetical protein UlMin_032239 [Ulmus minor]
MVESRKLAALLSSLISQLFLLLILLFSSSSFNSDSSYSPLKKSPPRCPSFPRRFGCWEKSSIGFDSEPRLVQECFSMTSSTFEWLAGSLEPMLDCRDPVGFPLNLSAKQRLGISLFCPATGSDCKVLYFRFWVNFLNSNELESVSASLEERTGLPNCCGAISCARFKIMRNDEVKDLPESSQEDSISAQIVVDSSSRILSIVARFRGDRNDSRILKSSTLYKDIEGGRLLNSPPVYLNGVAIDQYFVGDGRYPLLPWLIVPFVDAIPGSSEEYFNAAHKQIRLSASRTILSLKNWGVLSQPIREEVKTVVAYVGACSTLHNALLMREDYSALSDDLEAHSLYDRSSQDQRDNALVIRSALASRAKEFHNPNYQSNPWGSVQFQST